MLGDVINKATEEVKEASALVKTLTDDVQKGIATKSELAAAVADLEVKARKAAILAKSTEKGLQGLERTRFKFGRYLLLLIGVVLFLKALKPKTK